jgi:hypothetical protein
LSQIGLIVFIFLKKGSGWLFGLRRREPVFFSPSVAE